MKKILILSVGGSSEPVINAVNAAKADHVYFFWSSGPKGSAATIDGPGDPCADLRKSTCPECGKEHYIGHTKGKAIATRAALDRSRYTVVTVEDPDDLNECHNTLLALVKRVDEEQGADCRVVANYTGGTKTMSVAMALVGLITERWDLSVNVGPRIDLIKVTAGDVPISIQKWQILCEARLDGVRTSIREFDYACAMFTLTDLLAHPLPKPFRDRLIQARQLCQAFDLWDKFDHAGALTLLTPYGARFSVYLLSLKGILKKTKKWSGYERVGDLINNAERKARRGYYDDAVARLYRAMELLAQTRMELKFGYHSESLTLKDLPEHLWVAYGDRVRDESRLILGLRDDYELLARHDDPVGILFEKNRRKILDALKRRNEGIGGHGLTPLGEEDYRYVHGVLTAFLDNAAQDGGIEFRIAQLPREGIV